MRRWKLLSLVIIGVWNNEKENTQMIQRYCRRVCVCVCVSECECVYRICVFNALFIFYSALSAYQRNVFVALMNFVCWAYFSVYHLSVFVVNALTGVYEAVIEVENCLTKCAQKPDNPFSNGKEELFLVFYRFCFLHLRNHFTQSPSSLLTHFKLFNHLISVWWHYFEYLRCFQHWCVHNICQLFGAWQRCRGWIAQHSAQKHLKWVLWKSSNKNHCIIFQAKCSEMTKWLAHWDRMRKTWTIDTKLKQFWMSQLNFI